MLPTIIVAATLNIASAILMESTLSFLGLGVQAPAASWGSMLNNAQSYIGEASWLAMFPGILILLTVFSFNVLGDVFRTAFERERIAMSNLLALENLQTTFRTREGEVHAVRGVSFQVQPGSLSASSASRAAGKASPVSRSFSFWGATDG